MPEFLLFAAGVAVSLAATVGMAATVGAAVLRRRLG
jgi:hypothetical protein